MKLTVEDAVALYRFAIKWDRSNFTREERFEIRNEMNAVINAKNLDEATEAIDWYTYPADEDPRKVAAKIRQVAKKLDLGDRVPTRVAKMGLNPMLPCGDVGGTDSFHVSAMRSRRIQMGLTLRALSAIVGWSGGYLGQVELGNAGASPEMVAALSKALQCPPEQLLGQTTIKFERKVEHVRER